MRKYFIFEKLGIVMLVLLALASCKKQEMPENGYSKGRGSMKKLDITFYGLAGGTVIDKISISDNRTSILGTATITGLQSQETILAIDFRPATGHLYGISSGSRLYVINPLTGAARMIGPAPINPVLSGNIAGFDFNPTVDRIRLVTSSGQNLRLNPETGTVAATDLPINGVTGAMITGVAYTNNVAGAATTTLYDIDVTTQKLYRQIPPNDGKLVEVGPLKLKVTGEGGFDISPIDSIALGLYTVNNIPTIFKVNLSTGEATTLAKSEKKVPYTGIAIPTNPVAYAVDMTNNLLIFNPANPGKVITKMISGLAMGEKVAGIDFRPSNGQLYALTNNSRIITLNASSGASANVGTLSTPLSGTDFGFDFNPTVDRIRIISNTGQNLRYNPNDPSLPVTVDGSLNPGSPTITAAAYSNNFAGATSTMLFDIDVATDKLYLQSPPNNGGLVEIGNLNYNIDAANGFDIGGTSGTAWAILMSNNRSRLFTINTTTGAATVKGDFPAMVNGFTIGLGF